MIRLAQMLTVACVAGLFSLRPLPAAAQSCPEATTMYFSGELGANQSATHNIDLQPCETVKILLSGSGSTNPNGNGLMEYKARNSSGQTLASKSPATCGVSCSWELPTPIHYPGGILPGTLGAAGLVKDVVVITGTFNFFGGPTFHYTLTIIRTPRPGYNLGGTGFGDAPDITDGSMRHGSLHKWESGQFFKVHLNNNEPLYVSGDALGMHIGTLFVMTLYNSSQQSVFTLLSKNLYDTPSRFPADGANAAVYVYKNTGPAADFYIKAWADPRFQDYVMDFNFQAVRAPRLVVTPTTVTRGGSATFAIQGALNPTITGWTFAAEITGGSPGTDTVTRTTGTTALTWPGTIVAAGIGSVTVSGVTLSASVGVTPRQWFSQAKQAQQQAPGYEVRDPVTQNLVETLNVGDPNTGAAGVGITNVLLKPTVSSSNILTISDNGPNHGLKYLVDISDLSMVNWTLHPDVDNTLSDWYTHQYGNWVSAPGTWCYGPHEPVTPDTFISGENFSLGIHRHEVDPFQNSHYYDYKSSQDEFGTNFKAFAENQLGYTAYSTGTFMAIVNGRLDNDAQLVRASIELKGEPCSQHCSADCQGYNGKANTLPYKPNQ